MYREKRRNKIIILILVGIICLMGAGYAAFKTSINITGIGNISGEWSIRITNVEVFEEHNGGTNKDYTFKDVSATLEADLYNPGDYVIYNITVANNGDFDAKLESLGLEQSTNEAVLITSTGLVSGQTLYKEESITFSVKIEYNSNYVGDAAGTSGMAEINLDFVQNSGGTIVPTEDYLVHYDYTTNGGVSTNAEDEYVTTGTAVNLNYTAVKENAEFIGWNTNSEANEGLESLTMPNSEITLYAIFKDKDNTPPVISNVSTSSTINSITVVTTATEEDGEINHYEYSIDNGSNWIKVSGTNNYTFTGLTSNTNYKILVRVYNESEKYSEEEVNVSTKKLNAPTFSEKKSDNGKIVIISYPEGEGLIYEYQKDSSSWTTATQNQNVEFTESGTLVARVSDGTNEESSSYSVEIKPSIGGTEVDIVTSGDGLYVDQYQDGRYVYRGSNPNNYITFNNEMWRIISIESDYRVKIIRYDFSNNSTPFDSDDGVYWSSASLKEYLNGNYYNSLSSLAQNQIVSSNWAVAEGDTHSDLGIQISEEQDEIWKGKVALISVSDYINANSDVELCGTWTLHDTNDYLCKMSNWLFNNKDYWTLAPLSYSFVWSIEDTGGIGAWNPTVGNGVRPVAYLKANIIISGNGTIKSPYQLSAQ